MIQALQPGGPQWAVSFVEGASRGFRVPHAVQSAAAADLLAQLRLEADLATSPSSKSHSRAAVAAAVNSSGIVGIDIEHRTPGRPIVEIARYLMGARPRDEIAAYRVFTFREAYFKALGEWPGRALLQAVSEGDALRYVVPEGLNAFHELVGEDFLLTLVWRR